jgi:hypothetical protein
VRWEQGFFLKNNQVNAAAAIALDRMWGCVTLTNDQLAFYGS